MSVMTRMWTRTALIIIAGAAMTAPMTAKASLTDGLSVRIGFYHPDTTAVRNVTDFAVWGAGIEYKVGWIPHVFNGEHWSSSISADFHYSERKAGIVRFFPVSVNQVYSFEAQDGHAPYAGFCITGATVGTTGTGPGGVGGQPTVTRLGGGLIAGMNWSKNIYLEGRYEWFDKHNLAANIEGFRGYLGYRF